MTGMYGMTNGCLKLMKSVTKITKKYAMFLFYSRLNRTVWTSALLRPIISSNSPGSHT